MAISPSTQSQTTQPNSLVTIYTQVSVVDDIKIYCKMRDIKVPLTVGANNIGIKIDALFTDTVLTFTATTLSTAHKEAVDFIEEMEKRYLYNKSFTHSP